MSKFRTGFVSNSSSSTFVIGKNFMSKEQIREFKELINDTEDNSYFDETYINEDKNYFFGDISHHDNKFNVFFDSNNLYKFVGFGD